MTYSVFGFRCKTWLGVKTYENVDTSGCALGVQIQLGVISYFKL